MHVRSLRTRAQLGVSIGVIPRTFREVLIERRRAVEDLVHRPLERRGVPSIERCIKCLGIFKETRHHSDTTDVKRVDLTIECGSAAKHLHEIRRAGRIPFLYVLVECGGSVKGCFHAANLLCHPCERSE